MLPVQRHCRAVSRASELPALAQDEGPLLPDFCDDPDFPNVFQIKVCTALQLADVLLLAQRRANFFK